MRHVVSITLAMLLLSSAVMARDFKLGDLSVVEPWARATIGKARSGAVYLTVVNKGQGRDHIIALKTPVARHAQIHSQEMKAGIMKMRPTGPLAVKKHSSAVLQPGGMHVMLMGLQKPLREGESFPLTLTFEKAGSITLDVSVRNFAAKRSKHQ